MGLEVVGLGVVGVEVIGVEVVGLEVGLDVIAGQLPNITSLENPLTNGGCAISSPCIRKVMTEATKCNIFF